MTASPDLSRKQRRLADKHPHSRGRAQRRLPAARRPARRVKVTLRKQLSSAVALAFAALLAVSVSVPALAVNPYAQTLAVPTERSDVAVQNVTASENGTITVTQDTFSSQSIQETLRTEDSLPGVYAQTANTYTNDLGSAIQWPFLVGVPISTDFGPRIPPCDGCSSFHKGLDMNPGVNTPIQAVANGVVREISSTDNSGLGVYAIIDHIIDGRLVSSLYAHMTEGTLALAVGDPVLVGQLVGNVGNTGQSTGPHLHFEILLDGVTPTDPYAWLTEKVSTS
ncbi:murein DD-endopeptidase MepM/ murein hydrolase activator NlpD [Cryobacterium sp. MP_3.1]|uniref:M23 family metallopeptidase n=1 Tax=Cryobacterium sp. MP_3.1 TaxID=3071711 RepID=UPI002E048AE6|nr:murein DD-endopeptidase MepM/ murein hydrolase activator NlpD [Cryobacterium sp. MP_3.1]